MTDVVTTDKVPSSRRWPLLAALIAVALILGAAAGIYAHVFLTPATELETGEKDHGEGEAAEASTQKQEFVVGRLTVVIPSDSPASGKLHLVITPLVVGHPMDGAEPEKQGNHGSAEEEASATGPIPELRDAFIEYLSQLHESEIRGSIGLVRMRSELLRRVRAVAPELNASAVLIQEFIIQ